MADIRCYFYEDAGTVRQFLRRYSDRYCEVRKCSHDASSLLNVLDGNRSTYTSGDLWDHNDSRWPKTCECGYSFEEDDYWQLFHNPLFLCRQTGDVASFRELPVGAMWHADWQGTYNGMGIGSDGHCLMVRTPGGDWNVDSRASNCTMPSDNEHRCWVRHGEAPIITVDKNGRTCQAGAGSIACGNYHGFLQNGFLTNA